MFLTGLASQQSLHQGDSPAVQDLMEQGVRDLLATCAKYNLDQGMEEDPPSEAVLEQIRLAD